MKARGGLLSMQVNRNVNRRREKKFFRINNQRANIADDYAELIKRSRNHGLGQNKINRAAHTWK